MSGRWELSDMKGTVKHFTRMAVLSAAILSTFNALCWRQPDDNEKWKAKDAIPFEVSRVSSGSRRAIRSSTASRRSGRPRPSKKGFDDYTTEYPVPFLNPADGRFW
jgi:hypothetical protein